MEYEVVPREELLRRLQCFADNPSDETADKVMAAILAGHQTHCWLVMIGFLNYNSYTDCYKCPSICPGIERFLLCNAMSFLGDWKANPSNTLLFVIQLLALLKSAEG